MKKTILTLGIITTLTSLCFGQNTFPSSGNVGFGTINPLHNLDIHDNIQSSLRIKGQSNSYSWNARLLLDRTYDYRGAGVWITSDQNEDDWYAGVPYTGAGYSIGYHGTQPHYDANSFLFINQTGDVGIGTALPNSKLHLRNDVGNATFIIQGKQDQNVGNYAELILSTEYSTANTTSGTQTGRKTLIRSTAGYPWGNQQRLGFFTSSNASTYPEERMVILPNGNVGIGTTSPTSKLHVSNGCLTLDGTSPNWNTWKARITAPMGSAWVTNEPVNSGADAGQYLHFGMTNSGWFWGKSPNAAGATGTNVNYALSLSTAGLLTAREIKVTLNGWSDFVFKEDYSLRTLEEVETFIAKNNHLPDVPSEKEVLEKGVKLGEMDAILLQKIEELTLYILKQEKRINELEKESGR